jgi:hypothetical protein
MDIYMEEAWLLKEFFEFGNHYHIHYRAIINGIRLTGRGIDCTENYYPDFISIRYGAPQDYYPRNPKNILKHNWHYKHNINSWALFNNLFCTEEDVNKIFGQINFFFRLEFNHEPYLFGLPMASIVMRKTIKINTLKTYK